MSMSTVSKLGDRLTRFVSPYGEKLVVNLSFILPSMTKQSFKAECDINGIMAKYQRSGTLTWLSEHQPQYGDASAVDFSEAMSLVAKANEAFDALPSSLRRRFGDDPARFLEFVDDPANDLEAIKLGIKVANSSSPVPAPLTPPVPAGGSSIAS